ncbi:carboxymuconolactone decarboxylase family protein [Gloeocapsopsis dulcis]|uniref:Carboxymuconolactone decarboxylase-like domain-containing protein n=1 Tax=Gloeocapsopsis dulcis AAB1 = 1H9 TaxID=1433147 RepID=A0A6N8G0Z2_9CHRO|nr:carboxymuconolactone decarboxylase family protein [Gloeocapsopsis dulcis]MUL39070.1 hypothetical protein [Gloeocapsopsis dulcis AAB1 = 1H9]WNN92131.1 carboxymuconolactone decarboxylase family protein [Gloeocapsopsis dulcis]
MKKPDAPDFIKALNDLDPAFGNLAVQHMGEIWSRPGLTLKERAFISIVCDVCNQTLSTPFEYHIKMALENGATRQDVKEAVLHTVVYDASTKCLEAIAKLKELYAVFDKMGLYLTGDKVSHLEPAVNWVLDTDVKDRLLAFDSQYGDLVARHAGEIWSRSGLTPMERIYISLAGDVCQQTLSDSGPFPFHINLCLQNGLSREQVYEILLHLTIEAGFPKVWQAFNALKEHFVTLDQEKP